MNYALEIKRYEDLIQDAKERLERVRAEAHELLKNNEEFPEEILLAAYDSFKTIMDFTEKEIAVWEERRMEMIAWECKYGGRKGGP